MKPTPVDVRAPLSPDEAAALKHLALAARGACLDEDAITYERDDDQWWCARSSCYPGAYGQGRTKDEAHRDFASAVHDLTHAYAVDAAKTVNPFTPEGHPIVDVAFAPETRVKLRAAVARARHAIQAKALQALYAKGLAAKPKRGSHAAPCLTPEGLAALLDAEGVKP